MVSCLALVLLLVCVSVCVAAGVTVGGIAVVGVNTANPDSFALVALENIRAGELIRVTDNGWSSTGFRMTEGTMLFSFTAHMPAGYVWYFENGNTSTYTNEYGSWTLGTGFALSNNGDQIFVYTGSDHDPFFIYGVSSDWSEATSASTSLLPEELNISNAYVTLGDDDNEIYNYTSRNSGSKEEILLWINDVSNWLSSNVERFDMNLIPEFIVTSESDNDDGEIVSESGAIAIILVCLLLGVGAVVNEVVACKKKESRNKQLRQSSDDNDESKL